MGFERNDGGKRKTENVFSEKGQAEISIESVKQALKNILKIGNGLVLNQGSNSKNNFQRKGNIKAFTKIENHILHKGSLAIFLEKDFHNH